MRSELAFQRAQRAKKDAADAMRTGDVRRASALYDEAGQALDAFKPMAAPVMGPEIAAEAELLHDLSERALHNDASRMAKFTEEDRHFKERRRGRRRR